MTYSWKMIAGAIGGVILLVALLFAIKTCAKQEDKDNANLVNQGATEERSIQQSETINAVQNANDAVTNPTSNELNVVCSTYDRNCPHSS